MRREFMRSRVSELPSRQSLSIPLTDWYPSLAAAGLGEPLAHSGLRHWLTLEGSLTRALQLRCSWSFDVRIIAEGFARPTREEARALNTPSRQYAWIREVCLCGDGQPWVLARTIIPLHTLQGHNRRLRHLGRKPLGAYLFSSPEWQRGPIEIGLCHSRNPAQPSLARRSRFTSGRQVLLVGEYFLPALLAGS